VFIAGNHDRRSTAELFPIHKWNGFYEIEEQGQQIMMNHWRHEEWPDKDNGSWLLHGHMHLKIPKCPLMKRLDVGVDGHDFWPWSFDQVREVIN
jgi:calcineurin-like phosphoesterase family protein